MEQSKEELKRFLAKNPLATKELDIDLSNNTKPRLLVFVSTSMPITLLQAYFKEASKYGAALVFKGLPNGSFKELTNLIIKLEEENKNNLGNTSENSKQASAMIDDESFTRFGIESIPSFVLVKEEECFEFASCKVTYDKVVGNISILGALHEFEKEGDLRKEAHDILMIEVMR